MLSRLVKECYPEELLFWLDMPLATAVVFSSRVQYRELYRAGSATPYTFDSAVEIPPGFSYAVGFVPL